MLVMTATTARSSAAATSARRRLTLVPADARRTEAPLRRYRLARVQLEGGSISNRDRFAHLRRSYD